MCEAVLLNLKVGIIKLGNLCGLVVPPVVCLPVVHGVLIHAFPPAVQVIEEVCNKGRLLNINGDNEPVAVYGVDGSIGVLVAGRSYRPLDVSGIPGQVALLAVRIVAVRILDPHSDGEECDVAVVVLYTHAVGRICAVLEVLVRIADLPGVIHITEELEALTGSR